jgi:asparagine synthase (glutamine-hydrolysing)
MGTRPLCWARAGDHGLVFGSSADDVRRHPAVDGRVNAQAVYDYVYFHMVPSPGTIYREIAKLPRASVLELGSGTEISIRRWWQPVFVERADAPVEALGQELRAVLRDSVARCEPGADAASFSPAGSTARRCAAFTARPRDARRPPTRSASARQATTRWNMRASRRARFGLELREHYVTPDDIAASMRDIARTYDEPFGNSSTVPTLACARRAHADGIRVMLAGDGGDEIFAGNERYARQSVFEHYWRIPAALRASVVEPLATRLLPAKGGLTPLRKLRSYVEQARVPMPARLETYNFIQRMTPQALFEPAFLARVDTGHPPALLDASYDEAPARTLVNRMMYLDWTITLADNDLRKVGRMCGLAGIDVRYPMLDDALIDLSLRVPAALKLKGNTLRWFYKQALRDFLPPEIIAKTKHGFGLPFGVWLAESAELQQLVYGSLEALKGRGILRPDFIDRLCTSQRDEHAAYYGDLVWVLAMLELWLSEHGVGLE